MSNVNYKKRSQRIRRKLKQVNKDRLRFYESKSKRKIFKFY